MATESEIDLPLHKHEKSKDYLFAYKKEGQIIAGESTTSHGKTVAFYASMRLATGLFGVSLKYSLAQMMTIRSVQNNQYGTR